MRYVIAIVLTVASLLILFYFFSTQQQAEGAPSMPIAEAFIELNISPEKFVEINQVDEKSGINRQPAGMNFYRVRWPSNARGKVFLEHGPHSFTIHNALGVSGIYDLSFPEKGLYTFQIGGGMATQSDIYHDEARLRFLEFLSMLRQKGWQTFIGLSEPRLSTEQALKYALQENNVLYSLPIDAEPNLDTWMQIDDNEWHMFAGNVFMKVGFKRDSSRLELDKPSAYLFSYEIFDGHELIMRELEYEERERAAQIWPKRQQELKARRLQKEAMLQVQEYNIDTSYVDPELKLEL